MGHTSLRRLGVHLTLQAPNSWHYKDTSPLDLSGPQGDVAGPKQPYRRVRSDRDPGRAWGGSWTHLLQLARALLLPRAAESWGEVHGGDVGRQLPHVWP